MGSLDKNVKFVNLLSKQNYFEDVSSAIVSPLFNRICIVSKLNNASMHLLPQSGDGPCLWKCSSKVKTCLFSEDGKQLSLLLSVNSIQIYKVDEDAVTLTQSIKASAIATLLKNYNIDYSVVSEVRPLSLKMGELLLEVDGRLVCLEWGFQKTETTVRYTVVLPSYSELCISQGKIFLLLANSVIISYNASTGQQFQEDLNPCLAHRANADISIGTGFFKFSVSSSSKLLAVVNQNEVTVIFDIAEAFDRPDIKPNTSSEIKKEKWSWPGKRKSIMEARVFPGKILGQVEPFPGVVVSKLHFSLHGLFIFYSVLGHKSCSSFKVVSETNGDLLCAMDGLVEYVLVSGGSLPLFMSDSILSICLGALSTDSFVSKLCELIPDFGGKETDGSSLVEQESVEVYSNFMKIVFSLHSNVCRTSLDKLTNGDVDDVELAMIEKKLTERVEHLCGILLERRRDDKLNAFGYLHLVHLLDLTCLQIKKAKGSCVERLESLVKIILKLLLSLYPRIVHLDLLRYEWATWREVAQSETVQEAVILGTVALALVFFTSEKSWDPDQAVDLFKTEAKQYIVELISMGDLEKAALALMALGCDPLEHFRELCLDTNDPLMRDLLAHHLKAAEKFSSEEESAWAFCKKVEAALSTFVKNYRSFEHKMVVSATEKANIIMINLVPFKGTLDLRTVLKNSLDWRDRVLTELYFTTGDVTLEAQLDRDLCWSYLFEKNCIDLLLSWVDSSLDPDNTLLHPTDYLSKMFLVLFARWPVTAEMLEEVPSMRSMSATKCTILDRAASYGFFSTSEQKDMAAVVLRLQNLGLVVKIEEILAKPTANVAVDDFYGWILDVCGQNNLKLPVLTCLKEAILSSELSEKAKQFPWIAVWKSFELWDGKDKTALLNLIQKSCDIVPVDDEDKPLLQIAAALVEGKEVLSLIEEEEGDKSDLLKIPLIDICWQSLQRSKSRSPDVSLYDLLVGSKLPVEKLFAWQTENTYVKETHIAESFPHFNHQVLSAKHGYKQNLDYIYYLRQSRPSFACNLFMVENLVRTHRRLTTKMINRACGHAHGLALRLWKEESVGRACVCFIAMLGDIPTANALRLHLSAISAIADYLPSDQKQYMGLLTYGIVTKNADRLQEMATLLERAVMESISDSEKLVQLREWSVPVTFANMHGFPLPTLLPKQLAQEQDWFNFILCLDLFKYPCDQALELIEGMESPILKAHLLRALTRTTIKLATTSPSKSPPRIHLEPDSGGEDAEVDVFHTYVRKVYTEVLTTIQSFTDRNIVLPWSCEQNPDEDVLLTLLKCENEPDTGRALLVTSLELQSPILALLSTCYHVENVLAPLIAWLLSSVPTSLSRSSLREDMQLLPHNNTSSEEIRDLLYQVFTTGYFQTFYRGMYIFMGDNPLTLVVEAIYKCIVEIDTENALVALKNFVVEIHGNVTRFKEVVLGSREWIVDTAALLIKSVLIRSDVLYSAKFQFLRLLAESEFTSVDPDLPKFLLWYQICEILEPTQVILNFAALYNVATMSAEMERCLDELFRARAFAPAMEISALLSLNKDRIVTAIWEQQFEEVIAHGDVSRLWAESFAAFKDENVNPRLVASFYYKMAQQFGNQSPERLKNKYLGLKHCLTWRKLVEDTQLPSFREESDTVELEQWQCCLEEGFEPATMQSESSLGVAFSLVVSQWPAPKLLVRAPAQSSFTIERVSWLINTLLDTGDLLSAMRVSAFFNCHNQDLVTISSCLQATLGEMPITELSKYSTLLVNPPRPLVTPEVPVDVDGFVMVPPNESVSSAPSLTLIERLCAVVKHGSALANRILVCHRLSLTLDVPFKEIAAETDYLALLGRSITTDCPNKMAVARDILTIAALPDAQLAAFLSDRLVNAVTTTLATGLDVPASLWDVNLDEEFHRIIALMQNPSLLGSELLNASATVPFPEGVEILIRSHDCYTVACNVEGIGKVLRRARILAQQVLQTHQWRYLVRLLVGVERYSDMSYIFQMLKDNYQFEHLLRKGLTKATGFRLAVSDFLQRTCPEDRDIAKMVAAYFGLHNNQAAIWQAEADDVINGLTPPLKDSSKTRQALTVAMENYSHAANWYLQGGKMNKALKMSKQAQIVALQMSLLGGPFILNLDASQLQTLSLTSLSVTNIQNICKAKEMEIDWLPIVHERWVVHGDKTFFNDLKTAHILTAPFVTRYIHWFEKDVTVSKQKDRLKQLSALLPSQNNLFMKDLLRNKQRISSQQAALSRMQS